MTAGVEIVKGVENDIESRKPIHIELAVLDIRMMCDNICVGLERLCNFSSDLMQPTLSELLRGDKATGRRECATVRQRDG